MTERYVGAALRAALPPGGDTLRQTITIEVTRRRRGGPVDVTVELETVDAHGQAVRQYGAVLTDERVGSPISAAIRRACDDDPAERHRLDVLEWLGERAVESLAGVPLVERR